jgi:hypothetical protein
LSDFLLDGEYVLNGAIVPLGPEVGAACRIDELSGDADSVARTSHVALYDEGRAEDPVFCRLSWASPLGPP